MALRRVVSTLMVGVDFLSSSHASQTVGYGYDALGRLISAEFGHARGC